MLDQVRADGERYNGNGPPGMRAGSKFGGDDRWAAVKALDMHARSSRLASCHTWQLFHTSPVLDAGRPTGGAGTLRSRRAAAARG